MVSQRGRSVRILPPIAFSFVQRAVQEDVKSHNKIVPDLYHNVQTVTVEAKQDAAPVIPAVGEDDSLNSKLKVTFDRNSTSFKWSMVDGKMCLEIETLVGVNPLVVESS